MSKSANKIIRSIFIISIFSSFFPLNEVNAIGTDESKIISILIANPNSIILDIRWQDVYDVGHLPGAVLIDNGIFNTVGLRNNESLRIIGGALLNNPIIIICNCPDGSQAREIDTYLTDLGYNNAFHLQYSFSTWKDQNFIITGNESLPEFLSNFDSSAPFILSSNNITYEFGTIGNSIVWNITDMVPKDYQILRNDTVISFGEWDGSSITYSVDGLSPGIYNYTLLVSDYGGRKSFDSVIVKVVQSPETTNSLTTLSTNDSNSVEGSKNTTNIRVEVLGIYFGLFALSLVRIVIKFKRIKLTDF
jgi:rhodanese-related sulfurtransferase